MDAAVLLSGSNCKLRGNAEPHSMPIHFTTTDIRSTLFVKRSIPYVSNDFPPASKWWLHLRYLRTCRFCIAPLSLLTSTVERESSKFACVFEQSSSLKVCRRRTSTLATLQLGTPSGAGHVLRADRLAQPFSNSALSWTDLTARSVEVRHNPSSCEQDISPANYAQTRTFKWLCSL